MAHQLLSLRHLAGKVIAKHHCLNLLLLLCNYENELLQYIICWLSMADILAFSLNLSPRHRLPQPLTSCAYYNFIVDLYKVTPNQEWNDQSFAAYFKFDALCLHWLEWYDVQCRCILLNTFTRACFVFSEYQLNAILFVQQFCLTLYVHVIHNPTLFQVSKMHLFFQQGMACPILILHTLPITTSYKTFQDALFKSGNVGDIQRVLSPHHRQMHLLKLLFMQDLSVYPPLAELPCPSLSVLTLFQRKWIFQYKRTQFCISRHQPKALWYHCSPITYPILDKSCFLFKEMLLGVCHMRMGRYYFALVNWYTVLCILRNEPMYSLGRPFTLFVMCKFVQTLIALHCPVNQLLPLFQVICNLATPYVDQDIIYQTAHCLLAQQSCYPLSKSWLYSLTDSKTFFTTRYAFEIIVAHIYECFVRVEDLLALELQRMLCSDFNAPSALFNASILQRYQPIKAILFRIYYLITQKLQPALHRFYFNRYLLYTIDLLKIHYDIIILLLKKQKLDIQWTLNAFALDMSDLRRRIDKIIDIPYLISNCDVQYLYYKRFKYIVDPIITSEQFTQYCINLRHSIVHRTLQDESSLEEAHHFFSFGVLANGFQLNQHSYPYFTKALRIYEKQPGVHPRLKLCKLLAQAEDLFHIEDKTQVNQSLSTYDHTFPIGSSDSLKTIKTILKTIQSVDHSSVEPKVSMCSNLYQQQWKYFEFDHLKTIPVFVSALQQINCPHDYATQTATASRH